MADPVADWGAQVMPRGFKLTGDVSKGIRATVPYLLAWANTYGFCNAILGPVSAVHIGPISFTVPYAFPGGAVPIYAQRYTIEPCGADGTTMMVNRGLSPGEFFTNAIVTVEFEQVNFTWQAIDDPNGLQQLDPENPITLCEQSVKIGGKMRTRKGLNYIYSDTSTPVVGDVGVFESEAKLILKFPRVAYLPWTLLVPYVGKVNADPLLLCDTETLLLEAPSTEAKASLNSPTPIEQAVTLEFAYDPLGWNTAPKPNGTRVRVTLAGDATKSIYGTTDFRTIFTSLSFSEA